MGFCHEPTPEMGPLSVETRSESFYLSKHEFVNAVISVAKYDHTHASLELLYADIPFIRAALDQAEAGR